jgi:aarF domain-containing kinase
MAGRRLIDAAKLFNAGKSIAQQHVKLRSQQLDVYSKTSSLAKAAKSQTDRVTLTLDAAVKLSRRMNEEAPRYAEEAARRASEVYNGDVSRAGTVQMDTYETEARSQNHGQGEKRTDSAAEDELNVQQEKARRRPLADGTIPSTGTTLEHETREQAHSDTIPSHANDPYRPPPTPQVSKLQADHDRDVFYARSVESKNEQSLSPKVQIPEHTEDVQKSDEHVRDSQLNQDVYYAVPKPGQEQTQKERLPHKVAVPEQDDVPEGINTDVFRTQRVAKMLGGNPYKRKDELDLKGAARTPQDNTKTAVGHDQDTFNVRSSGQSRPSAPEQPAAKTQDTTAEKEMQDLASELAKDAETTATTAPAELDTESQKAAYELRESRVPSSRFGRFWQYAGLGTSMAFGAVGESLRRATGSAASTGGSLMLSPGNIELLVAKLSRMRGAALKLGQMISIQGTYTLQAEHDIEI